MQPATRSLVLGALALGAANLGAHPAAADELPTVPTSGEPVGALDVAVAANLRAAFEEALGLARGAFPRLRIRATYGATGNFYAQLRQRAPFDLFLAADEETPAKLVAEGLADGAVFPYALGRLALWVKEDSPIPLETAGLGALVHPSVRYVATANPRTAPYGRAAVAALKGQGLYEALSPRLVPGNDISQAAQFVDAGTCQAGFVAYSQVLGPELRDKGRYLLVPEDSYPPIRQAGVVLAHSKSKHGARALARWLQGETFRALLTKYGYRIPEGGAR